MKFNRFLSKPKVFTGLYITAASAAFVVVIFLINWLENFRFESVFAPTESENQNQLQVPLTDTITSHFLLLMIILAGFMIGYGVFAYRIRVSHGNLNVGQKGTAR